MEDAARKGELAKMERALDAGRDVNTILNSVSTCVFCVWFVSCVLAPAQDSAFLSREAKAGITCFVSAARIFIFCALIEPGMWQSNSMSISSVCWCIFCKGWVVWTAQIKRQQMRSRIENSNMSQKTRFSFATARIFSLSLWRRWHFDSFSCSFPQYLWLLPFAHFSDSFLRSPVCLCLFPITCRISALRFTRQHGMAKSPWWSCCWTAARIKRQRTK